MTGLRRTRALWANVTEFFRTPTHEEIAAVFEERGFSRLDAYQAATELRIACRMGRRTPQWIMDKLSCGKLPLPKWVCRDCGYDGLSFEITKATVEVSVALGCPVCGGELFRDDPLGQIEMKASHDRGPS